MLSVLLFPEDTGGKATIFVSTFPVDKLNSRYICLFLGNVLSNSTSAMPIIISTAFVNNCI